MCYKVVAALLLMMSMVANAVASDILEGQQLSENGDDGKRMTTTFLLGDLLSPRRSKSALDDPGINREGKVFYGHMLILEDNSGQNRLLGRFYNNSHNSLHSISLRIVWRDKDSNELERVPIGAVMVGTPGQTVIDRGLPYEDTYIARYWENQWMRADVVIPQKSLYFTTNPFTIPLDADINNSWLSISWNIDSSVDVFDAIEVVPGSVDLTGLTAGERSEISFQIRNTTDVALTSVTAFAILLRRLDSGHYIVTGLDYKHADTFQIAAKARRTFSIDVYRYPKIRGSLQFRDPEIPDFNDTSKDTLIIRTSFGFVKPFDENPLRTDTTDKGFFVPEPVVTVVRDTVFVNSGADSLRISALKMGDLNEDGVINFTDFLIFTENFGKTYRNK